MIYQKNFTKLQRLLGDLNAPPGTMKLSSKGFMDLSIETIEHSSQNYTIALAHYYKQNGDLVPDPDMALRVTPDAGVVEGLTYQDSFAYRQVYLKPGFIDVNAKKDINTFLGTWLSNLLAQGFRASAGESLRSRRGA